VVRWLPAIALLVAYTALAADPCGGKGISVQVLGSGGPVFSAKRAGSSTLVWIDGKARVLIDAGGGAALRFAESGASFADLDVVLFTQLHASHTVDLPTFVLASQLENRNRPLPLYGPPVSRGMPSTISLIRDLFDNTRGTYRHLGEFISPLDKSSYKLEPHDVRAPPPKLRTARRASPQVLEVFRNEHLQIHATGTVPGTPASLAWRIEAGGKRLVFGSEGESPGFAELADHADLILTRADILPQTRLGELAQAAGAKRLVLAYRLRTTPGQEEETLSAIRRQYKGPVEFADDLNCYRP